MSKDILIQFVGFESKKMVREYIFTVREASTTPREFTIDITNEAFSNHRLRFQDAPDLCSHKLRRELAAYENHPPESHFHITDAELDEYRSGHAVAGRDRGFRKMT